MMLERACPAPVCGVDEAGRGPLAAFIKESIVTPAAYVAPGFPEGMPHIYGSQIPAGKLDQLVQYLAAGSK